MTAANKYACRLDRADKDCINDPLEAEGGKGEEEEKRRGKLCVVCPCIQYDVFFACR